MARGAIRIDWYPSDALGGMTFLTVLEELAYRRIIDLIYVSGGELPDDDGVLAEATRTFREWPAVRAGLLKKGKINIEGGCLTNARCTEILGVVAERCEKARAASHVAARKRRQLLPGPKDRPVRGPGPHDAPDDAPYDAPGGTSDDAPRGAPEGHPSQVVRESVRETDVSLTAREGFADFVAAYPKRDAVMAARPVWDRMMEGGIEAAEVMAGLERWKAHWRARIVDPKDNFEVRHIRNAARWLEEGGWLDPDPAPPAAPPAPAPRVWPGPAHVRAIVVAHAGEDFARSYLDPAGWEEGYIAAATATAADKLRALPALSAHPIRHRKETRS